MVEEKAIEGVPVYYGEIQPWAKVFKGVVSSVSIIVFLVTLFSKNHDVKGFLSSMLLASSPVFVDLLVIYDSLLRRKRNKINRAFLLALWLSGVSFAGPLVLLLLGGRDIIVVDAYLNGEYWLWSLVFFFPIIYSFCINVFRPIKLIDPDIRIEERQ